MVPLLGTVVLLKIWRRLLVFEKSWKWDLQTCIFPIDQNIPGKITAEMCPLLGMKTGDWMASSDGHGGN